MIEASHLFSISLSVASGVDFFIGASAADDAAFAGAEEALFAAGEGEVFVEEAGELLAAGEADFSVVTETLGSSAGDGEGSDFSGGVASGTALGSDT